MRRTEERNEGWTFLETIIVITAILILAATVGTASIKLIDRAREAAARSQIAVYASALEIYALDCGRVPTTEQGLSALWERPQRAPIPAGWSGPYLAGPPRPDPWGNDYRYRSPGPSGLPYGIVSTGRDGLYGGVDADADIESFR